MVEGVLAGAVALVTGADGEVGAATACRLAHDGAAVVLVAPGESTADVMGSIVTRGGRALAVDADITDTDQAGDAVQDAVDWFGRLDILVNSPGIMLLNSALHSGVAEWDRMIARNIAALLHVTHAAVPYLIAAAATSPRQVADLVNVSSTAGPLVRSDSSVYDLTRTGVDSFSESLRQELIGERVRVSMVAPAVEHLRAEDVADAIGYVVTREHRVVVNELVIRRGSG